MLLKIYIIFLILPLLLLYSIKTVDINIQNKNIKFSGFATDGIFINIADKGNWEPHISWLMKKVCSKGNEIVFDIGSNIGYQTLEFALAIKNNGGKVYSFEPHPSNYKILLKNLNDNQINNVIPYNNAIGDDLYTICFLPIRDLDEVRDNDGKIISLINSGDVRLPVNSKNTDCKPYETPISTMKIDSIIIDRLDFIKIDVQGYELKVLKSALKSILKYKPIIIIEFEEYQLERLGYNTIDLVNYIRNTMKYEVFFIAFDYPSDHLLIPLEKLKEFRKSFNKYIHPLSKSNNINRNIEAGVKEQICYKEESCWSNSEIEYEIEENKEINNNNNNNNISSELTISYHQLFYFAFIWLSIGYICGLKRRSFTLKK